ncbi:MULTISPECIES: phospholipase D-like domain-containing protein [unclassified Methanoregula]|uniref:phospholipase D-like domain-containing protein n=1 Tax=unclassified Methanoregula TaxID=2649730 RepID=UPI0009CB6F31|nr:MULTISPECIES: phospholipase D-like domain-containing protein [unclassified Methanoregula]OPX62212.1 MAG: hypothetical protein A4E33_02478 [Methanoregula sp. PtaB.Bin085]OPY35579.1 MAG: hypothetical protein A4E34_00579 [Methanoregula sp. PtaU1.Bin006]
MSDLYFSEEEIFLKKVQDFLSATDCEVLIISPYIKTDVLDILLKKCSAKINIITTWKLRDLQLGASELDLYQYCKKRGIFLYLNPRIHLKAFVNNYSTCIFGSANISKKGFALVADHNYELDGEVEIIDAETIIRFKKILNESILVNDEIYKIYLDAVKRLEPLPELDEPDISSLPRKSEFLISALPMSYDIKELFEIYSNKFEHESEEKRECAIHDIILYNLPPNLEYQKFRNILKERFFSSKFIQRLLEFITDNGRYFGEVKEWIQKNCEDVPVPSRRDLTGNIQVLYKWIADLSDGEYKVDRPRHSERLYRVKK